jgi:hypothetical protein
MIRSVYFSERASKRLDSIINYLENNWPTQVTKNFIDKFRKRKKSYQNFLILFPNPNIFLDYTNVLELNTIQCITEYMKMKWRLFRYSIIDRTQRN